RRRAFEWSPTLADWAMLVTDSVIADRALAVPLPVAALVDAADPDEATIDAYRAQRHPAFLAEREQGREQALRGLLRMQLVIKFGGLAVADEQWIAAATIGELERCLERIVTAVTLAEVLAP